MATIPLHDKHGAVVAVARVDDADEQRVLAFGPWHLTSNGYAAHSVKTAGAVRKVRLHRYVLGLADGDRRRIDHVNRDRLDCRRENLRFATPATNSANLTPRGESRYRGVRRHYGKWAAQVTIAGVAHWLGTFASEEEAAATARAFRLARMAGAVD